MQRIRNGTQVAALPPLEAAVGVGGYFANTANGGPTRVGQDWLNDVQEEIIQVILAAGIVLNVNVRTQLLQAIQALISAAAAPFLIDAGVANAYVLTPTAAISAYAVGQSFQFKAANTNTGASTVNISGVGAAPLVHRDGTALQAGDIPAGSVNTITSPDGVNFQLESEVPTLATTTLAGLLALASGAQTEAMAATNFAVTPADLALIFTASNAGASAGHYTSPIVVGGTVIPLIVNYGTFSLGAAGGASQSVSFDATFPNFGTIPPLPIITVAGAASEQIGYSALTASGMTLEKGSVDPNARSGIFIVIGC